MEINEETTALLIDRKKIIAAINSAISTIKFRGKSIHLSPREVECLVLTSFGFSAKEIGRKLSASHRTIENHIDNLKRKLGIAKKTLLSRVVDENKHLTHINFTIKEGSDEQH